MLINKLNRFIITFYYYILLLHFIITFYYYILLLHYYINLRLKMSNNVSSGIIKVSVG